MKTAKFIKSMDGFSGDAALYQCSPPMKDYDGNKHKFVIVSAVNEFRVETYIFPSNKNGDVTSWWEMPGSERGIFDHKGALANAGYVVK